MKKAHHLLFDYNFVTVKEFTARWGSCTSRKEIQLNTRLIMLKKRVIDYVIVHELCHTLYMNHQKGFKDKLASYFVDEKAIKEPKKGQRISKFSVLFLLLGKPMKS